MVTSGTKINRWDRKNTKSFHQNNRRHGEPELPQETEETKSIQLGKKNRKNPDNEWMAAALGLKGKCTKAEDKWKKQI